jgi:hypothetical protein
MLLCTKNFGLGDDLRRSGLYDVQVLVSGTIDDLVGGSIIASRKDIRCRHRGGFQAGAGTVRRR